MFTRGVVSQQFEEHNYDSSCNIGTVSVIQINVSFVNVFRRHIPEIRRLVCLTCVTNCILVTSPVGPMVTSPMRSVLLKPELLHDVSSGNYGMWGFAQCMRACVCAHV